MLYGSAARGDWVAGVSDINLLLVLDDTSPASLRGLAQPFTSWRRSGNAPPLVLSREEWAGAADAFPIEVTDILHAYKVVKGADPVAGMRVSPADLRTLLEHELLGKLLQLRRGYVALAEERAALAQLGTASISTIVLLQRALLAAAGPQCAARHRGGGAGGLDRRGRASRSAARVRAASRRPEMDGDAGTVRIVPGGRGNGCAICESPSAWSRVMKRVRMLGAALLVAFATTGCGYNQIQTKDEAVNKAKGNIETQLQRRVDLIPNLVETVKGAAAQETTVFNGIAASRAKLSGAIQSGDINQMAQANAAVRSDLGRLLAIVENYPTLKSSDAFRQLQDQLEGTENRIQVARQDYNAAANDFNAYIRQFPTNLTAKVFGMDKPRQYFEAEAGAQEAPKVKF